MRASLTASTRRRILADLGIEVWRARVPPAQPQAHPQAHPPPESPTAQVPDAKPEAPPKVARAPQAATNEIAVRIEGFALGVPGAVLLLKTRPVGRDARFARDLVAAAARSYAAEPELRHFEWPPVASLPGAMAPDAAQRALSAFIDKLLQDTSANALLLEEGIASGLAFATSECVVVPFSSLAELARDGAAKRAVWQSLRKLRVARRPADSAAPGVKPGLEAGLAPESKPAPEPSP